MPIRENPFALLGIHCIPTMATLASIFHSRSL